MALVTDVKDTAAQEGEQRATLRSTSRSGGRNNNFNLIRMVAAMSVLVAHCFPLTAGAGSYEPLLNSIGMTLGAIAVDVFFVTSGFLVTGSLLQRHRVIDFVWARTLRIFPALIVMLLFSVLCVGPIFTTEPLTIFLWSDATWRYLIRSIALVGAGSGAGLPGVFVQNPFPGVLNGSLWTLPYEVAMYAALVVSWFALRCLPGFSAELFRRWVFGLAFALGALEIVAHGGWLAERGSVHLAYMFFAGGAFNVFRDRIRFSWSSAIAMTALLASTLPYRAVFQVVYILTVPYLTLFLAFVPGGPIRKANALGDYSYGTYIYAFPIQQAVASALPGVTAGGMLVIAAPITLALAVCSWHLLEKRALELKGALADWTRMRLGIGA